jgi:putative redox protein
MPPTALVRSAEDSLRCEVEVNGRSLIVDEPEALGGTDTGPTPFDLLAASLASCIAITLRMYARRKDWKLGEVRVEVCLDRDDRPHCFTVTLHLPPGLTDDQQARLRHIAGACPVHRTLAHGLEFEHSAVVVSAA